MKNILYVFALTFSMNLFAQNNTELVNHYEAYYQQMKTQGDTQGIINAMTHLNILKPLEARKDTLAYIYLNEGKFNQALNTIGFEQKATDSKIALEVKAVALKSLGEVALALPFYQTIYITSKNAGLAYEIAEINLQLNNLAEAKKYVDLGLNSVTDKQGKAFYEKQQPYQVPLKAALYYLDALIKFNEDKATNIDAAVLILDKALAIEPQFNMATITKNALNAQKEKTTETKN
ncbi:hypothetical protein [Lacinutrix sp. Hel_I_90]|uniref:hypothetical protein n=1 Tax=Lacinutrix sp. Hel_I_90 TaxID=1249999 RepID=UPI0005CB3513|nr:hypothetical protein [Lacinutrix sp. Hel_I_90]